ncbi:MAG: hypothetical protein IT557_06145 [Alphaproteobacteria bacterium]|nr:hypothetical protein [Alphaproteobacteria bacterium]
MTVVGWAALAAAAWAIAFLGWTWAETLADARDIRWDPLLDHYFANDASGLVSSTIRVAVGGGTSGALSMLAAGLAVGWPRTALRPFALVPVAVLYAALLAVAGIPATALLAVALDGELNQAKAKALFSLTASGSWITASLLVGYVFCRRARRAGERGHA